MKRFWKSKKENDLMPPAPQNEYYESVSEKFGLVQVVLYLSLLAFVVLSFLQNTNLITYQNLYHFIKDLNASAETVDVWNTDQVSYPTDEKQSFTLYRHGLAVAGNQSVTIFTPTGRQTVSETVSYRNPVAVGHGKYLLVYDLGGTAYSLYNAYTQIHTGTTERPISGGAISDSGMYALISSSAEYTSVVSLYSSNFALLNVYSKNGYVMDVSIDPNGRQIALLTSVMSGGEFHTELMLCEARASVAKAVVNVADSLALSCQFTSGNVINILCSGGFYSFGADGQAIFAYDFEGDTVACFSESSDGTAICLKTLGASEKKHILLFDRQGALTYNGYASQQVNAIAHHASTVYLQTAYGVTRLDTQTGSTSFITCQTEQKQMLAVSAKEILLCSHQQAVYMNFES